MQEAAQEADEETAELGMAANSILQSIPPHVLKALEQQQVEANAVNAESKVSLHHLVITFLTWHGASHAEMLSFVACFTCCVQSGAWHACSASSGQSCLFSNIVKVVLILQVQGYPYKIQTFLLPTVCWSDFSNTMCSQVKRKKKKTASAQATVGSMRIITGSAAGRRLVSPPGEGTRPMMEKVRGAVFSMVASMAGSQPLLPPGTRWLDLFAGTGEAFFCFFWLCCCGEHQKENFCLCSGPDGMICQAMAYCVSLQDSWFEMLILAA